MAKTVTTTSELQNIISNARKLNEGEKLPIKDHAYGVSFDKNTGDITIVMTINARDMVKSAKGSNFVVPVANTTSARGTGVVEAHSEDGLTVRLFADRAYISTVELEQEKEKKATKKNDSEKALLRENLDEMKKQNEMLMNILKENGLIK
jgi:hypothetical protein|nr:MAG TPA: hypothetical protein [Caudoviricetes sp.]